MTQSADPNPEHVPEIVAEVVPELPEIVPAAIPADPAERQLVIDEAQLERLERELADAADTLEAVEQICAAGTGGTDTALAIRQLLDDGRFISVRES